MKEQRMGRGWQMGLGSHDTGHRRSDKGRQAGESQCSEATRGQRDQDGRASEEAEGGTGQNMNWGSRVNRCWGGKGRGHMVSKCCSTTPRHGLKTSRVFVGSFSSQQLELSGAVLMTLPGVTHGSKRPANQPGSDGPGRMSHTSSNWGRRAPLCWSLSLKGASTESSKDPKVLSGMASKPLEASARTFHNATSTTL